MLPRSNPRADQKSAVVGRRRLLSIDRHPRPPVLSAYLDGDLVGRRRASIERHLRRCQHCCRLLASLESTITSLASLREPPTGEISQSVIAVWRAELRDHPSRAVALQRPARLATLRLHLRGTLLLAASIGVVLSVVNQGPGLVGGEIDLRMCLVCGANFVAPFLALNLGLLMLSRLPGRSRR